MKTRLRRMVTALATVGGLVGMALASGAGINFK